MRRVDKVGMRRPEIAGELIERILADKAAWRQRSLADDELVRLIAAHLDETKSSALVRNSIQDLSSNKAR